MELTQLNETFSQKHVKAGRKQPQSVLDKENLCMEQLVRKCTWRKGKEYRSSQDGSPLPFHPRTLATFPPVWVGTALSKHKRWIYIKQWICPHLYHIWNFFHFKITLGKIWTTIFVHFAEENVSSEGGELVLCVEYRKSLKWYKPDLRTWLPGGGCPLNHLQISHNPISLENPGWGSICHWKLPTCMKVHTCHSMSGEKQSQEVPTLF